MTVQEFYATLGEDYDEVLDTLGKDTLIAKYLKRLVQEDVFDQLKAAMAAKDWQGVFMASHSLKGLALNLGLSKLKSVASDLSESTRGGVSKGGEEALFEKVAEVYGTVSENIAMLD